MPRFGVDRAVDRVDDDARRAARAEDALAELLRDEHEVGAGRFEPRDDRVLGGRVDRGRVVAAFASAQHRLTLGPRRQADERLLDVGDRRAAESEPVGHGSSGWKSRPESELREEVGRLLRHHLAAAGALEHVLDPRRAQQEGDVGLALVDTSGGLARVGRVGDPVVAERSTSSTSSSPGSPWTSTAPWRE